MPLWRSGAEIGAAEAEPAENWIRAAQLGNLGFGLWCQGLGPHLGLIRVESEFEVLRCVDWVTIRSCLRSLGRGGIVESSLQVWFLGVSSC